MKISILSESSADEAAIKILVEEILKSVTQTVSSPRLRPGGWPHVIHLLPSVLKFLHYTTDAEALVVIVDSDDSPAHHTSHDEIDGGDRQCRLCQVRNVVDSVKSGLTSVQDREIIKTAIGLAVPAIEAWYRCGLDPHVNEATWARRLNSERITYTRKSLKKDVYGTERPSIEIETTRATEAAIRLTGCLPLLEQLFPDGFGSFARDVRSW
jgi:hypothetical protein